MIFKWFSCQQLALLNIEMKLLCFSLSFNLTSSCIDPISLFSFIYCELPLLVFFLLLSYYCVIDIIIIVGILQHYFVFQYLIIYSV